MGQKEEDHKTLMIAVTKMHNYVNGLTSNLVLSRDEAFVLYSVLSGVL